MSGEGFNEIVREHELSASWEARDAAGTLHKWFGIFNDACFEGRLPRMFLRLDAGGVILERGDQVSIAAPA